MSVGFRLYIRFDDFGSLSFMISMQTVKELPVDRGTPKCNPLSGVVFKLCSCFYLIPGRGL